MTERVYVIERSEMEQLKKVLAYDPFTDPNIIPPASEKMTAEEAKAREAKIEEAKKKLPEGALKVIFDRQEYSVKDGTSVGLKGDFYLYINASDDFLAGAEGRFSREFKTVKRAETPDEAKVIEAIRAEKDRAAEGFGSIFG
ncbi:MAG: hypothetical protein KGH94_01590 [Candidatus Micrarchaeota archaeon]|nr:hypothetical protein [Candidatus Micrarchaeota archaeon]